MREIKFRAKVCKPLTEVIFIPSYRKEGEWVIGDLHLRTKIPHIHECGNDKFPIDINTIGQFTGLQDSKGNDIYEGDILCIKQHELDILRCAFRETEIICVVEFIHGTFIPVMKDGKGYCWSNFIYDKMPTADYTVIGNIHDNPELMEAKQ